MSFLKAWFFNLLKAYEDRELITPYEKSCLVNHMTRETHQLERGVLEFIATKKSVTDQVLALLLLVQHKGGILTYERVATQYAEVVLNKKKESYADPRQLLDKECEEALQKFVDTVQRKSKDVEEQENRRGVCDIKDLMHEPHNKDAFRYVLNSIYEEVWKAKIDVDPIVMNLLAQGYLDDDDRMELFSINSKGERACALIHMLHRLPTLIGWTFLNWLYHKTEGLRNLIDGAIQISNGKRWEPCC